MVRVQVLLDDALVARIDAEVGRGSRSAFLRDAAWRRFSAEERKSAPVEKNSTKKISAEAPSRGDAVLVLEREMIRAALSRPRSVRDVSLATGLPVIKVEKHLRSMGHRYEGGLVVLDD